MDALDDAAAALAEYDAGHRAAAASPGAAGLGGALTANDWAKSADRPLLGAAVKTVRLAAMPSDGRIMLGICAEDAAAGLAALKMWVSKLHLPRGVLHGMDKDGVALDMSDFGAVYIKYNSHASSAGDPPGTATLSGYNGDFRGVYFNPDLQDGEFRQYAVLPLDLFCEVAPTDPPTAPPSAASTAAATTPVAATPALAVGMAVLVRYGGKAAEYAGVLTATDADGLWDVVYDDGDRESRVRPELIRVRTASGGGAGAAQPNEMGQAVSVSTAGAASRSRAAAAATTSTSSADMAVTATFGTDGRAMATPAVPRRFSSVRRFVSREAAEVSEGDVFAGLHTRGWALLPDAHRVDESTVAAIRASTFEPIFNGHCEGTRRSNPHALPRRP